MRKPTRKAAKPSAPEPQKRTVTSLYLDPEMLTELKIAAARERRRVNDVVVEAIDQWLRRAA
jgi:hypothetical protein